LMPVVLCASRRKYALHRRCLVLVVTVCAITGWLSWLAYTLLLGNRICAHSNFQSSVCRWIDPPLFFRWSVGLNPTYKCKDMQRWGDEIDQGWSVCVDESTQLWELDKRKCVVYSFGINHQWSFDLAAVAKGCEVHSFDPTIIVLPYDTQPELVSSRCAAERRKRGRTSHTKDNMANANGALCAPNPSPHIHFHDWGLYGADTDLPGIGPVKRLSTIMRELGHAHVDILKADIEGGEWAAFGALGGEQMALLASSVSQLMLEIHMMPEDLGIRLSGMPIGSTPPIPKFSLPASVLVGTEFVFMRNVLRQLARHFEVAQLHTNPRSPPAPLGVSITRVCHEVVWVKRRQPK
jgi:hypothetical protein